MIPIVLAGLAMASPQRVVAQESEEVDPEAVFARVGDVEISVETYGRVLYREARNSFYHGRPPEGRLDEFHRRVARELVDHVVLQREGVARGLCEGPAEIAATDPERGQACRKKLREAVNNEAPAPSEEDLRAYYADHTDAFTEPERPRTSLILLRVPPSAPQSEWQHARDEAAALRKKVVSGEQSFSQAARAHSDDPSATEGGDMGYVHRGMLGEPAHEAIDALEVGEVSEPVRLLEGVGLFRVDDRQPAEQHEFEEVRERVRALWQRERERRRWEALIERLREKTAIDVDERYLEPAGPKAAAERG